MREIKLRGLDRNDGLVKEIERIDFKNEIALFVGEYGWVEFNNVELEQFTGLHDKNGVEIYENDTVRIENQNGEFDDFIIYAYGNTLCLDCGSHCGLDCDIYTLDFLSYGDDYESIEVIGNIHEVKQNEI